MGLDEKSLYKRSLISICLAYIEIAKLKKFAAVEQKDKDLCDKVVRKTKKAIKIIGEINHIEILRSIYNTFIGGKETMFAILVGAVNHKDTVVKWDKTEKGFQEFLQKEEEAKKLFEEEQAKKKAQSDAIKKAKEEGKNVEFVLKEGKLQPVITDKKVN